VPISYSPRNGQHHHHLRTYKQQPPSRQAQWNLLALILLFLREHLDHIATRVGAHPTHVVTVPSTRGRPGIHPLTRLLGDRLGLPWIIATTSERHGPEVRDFHRGWFTVTGLEAATPVHALIIEDTWTTGARAQSLAYTLKTAGAATVATVVLGRHVNPDHRLSQPLLTAIADEVFDIHRCTAEHDPTSW
jgi:predicted amidophosphoribosyltransferase